MNLTFFQVIDFDQVNKYGKLRKANFVGFAELYLQQYNKESKSIDEIDDEVYSKLVELDTKLGTTASEQLFSC